MDNQMNRMKELVRLLNEAGKAYYQEDREIMSNREYDRLYDELLTLEKDMNLVLADSPTAHVGYEAVDSLPKETHDSPMLSLDKTKERETLRSFVGNHRTLLSWKMDDKYTFVNNMNYPTNDPDVDFSVPSTSKIDKNIRNPFMFCEPHRHKNTCKHVFYVHLSLGS